MINHSITKNYAQGVWEIDTWKIQLINQSTLFSKLSDSSKSIFIPRSPEVGVLLLHSFTSTPHEFCDMALFLANHGVTVFAPTIAGHATTPDDLADTTIADWRLSVEAGFNFLQSRVKKVFIVGSSFGENLGFDLAAKSNKSIAGVISMGTPIKIRRQIAYKLALYSYGWLKAYQKKYWTDHCFAAVSQAPDVYKVIPIPSLRRFFNFIKKITIPSLSKITTPALIIQSNSDEIVDPKSAEYLHQHLGSSHKKILWVSGFPHTLAFDNPKRLIYNAIYRFILNHA